MPNLHSCQASAITFSIPSPRWPIRSSESFWERVRYQADPVAIYGSPSSPTREKDEQNTASSIGIVLIDAVGLRCHDEIIPVQVADLVRPPGDRDLAPLGGQARMMTFFFGLFADRIGESDSVFKVLELEQPVQLRNAVFSNNLPLGYLRLQSPDLFGSYRRRSGPACLAFLFG